jgi:FkbM family methyltransferase
MMDELLIDVLIHSQQYRKPAPLKKNNGQIFIYGTGTFATEIAHLFRRKGFIISAFLDHRGIHSSKDDLPVFRPGDPRISENERKNSLVVVGIHNREARIIPILGHLKDLGFGTILTPIDLYDYFADELGEHYWLAPRLFYSEYTPSIEKAYALFSDKVSCDIFTSLLRFRITGDYNLLPVADREHQYFPPDLPGWTQPLRFVDCGAYNGDTLEMFLRAGFKFQAVAAFEPDADNFHNLAAVVEKNHQQIPNVSLFPCGLFSSTTQITFEMGKEEASSASPTGRSIVQCVSLDECLPNFSPNLIKMDIEGAEIEALRGAEHTIQRYAPGLAISVYHRPSHLWEIPLLIAEMAQDAGLQYTYHLRAHAENDFDIIFYAIPQR